MFEFCICNGTDTEFCPFHDPKNIERKKMADGLQKMYEDAHITTDDTAYQIFQKGVTAGAVSMRARAMDCCKDSPMPRPSDIVVNEIKNAVGQLSDIPE